MGHFRPFLYQDHPIPEEALDRAIEAAESIASAMRVAADPLPDQCGEYLIARRLIDEHDVSEAITDAGVARRLNREHAKLFWVWLSEFRAKVRGLHRERMTALAAAGRWDEIPKVRRRYFQYQFIILRLCIAGFFRQVGVGNPTQIVMNCISVIRELERVAPTPIQSSLVPSE